MRIDIITIFPNQIESFVKEGIFRIAAEKGHTINAHDLRKWTTDKHKTVDDHPFGGGPGMVLMVEPIFKAVKALKKKNSLVILTGLHGKKLGMSQVKLFAKNKHIIIICGHYEGVDERVREHIADVEISVGDYVLSGGELPALIISDAIMRQLPGVLGNPNSLDEESFENGMEVEYPQYTRPEIFNGWKIPEILKCGNHAKIREWRKKMAR